MKNTGLWLAAIICFALAAFFLAISSSPKPKDEGPTQFTVYQKYMVTITVDGQEEIYYTYGIPLCKATDIEFKCASIGGPNIQLLWNIWRTDKTLLYSASAKAGITYAQTNYATVVDRASYEWYTEQAAKYDEIKKEWDAANK